MKYLATLKYYILLFLLPTFIQGQQSGMLEIEKVRLNESKRQLELYIKAFQEDNTDLFPLSEVPGRYDQSGINVFIQSNNNSISDSLQIIDLETINLEGSTTKEIRANPRILFLLDLSGSMRGTKIESAKQAIYDVLQTNALRGSKIEFAWFHNIISTSRTLNRYNYKAVVDIVNVGPPKQGKDTDLHRAIQDKVSEYSLFSGHKAIILLTDGKNDIKRNPLYTSSNPLSPITEEQILEFVRLQTLSDSLLQIFPVGIGDDPDEVFLKKLKDATKNPDDNYWYKIRPEEISNTFQRIVRDISAPNFVIAVKPSLKDARFGSGDRTFLLNYVHPETNELYVSKKTAPLGSNLVAPDISRPPNYVMAAIIGIIFLGVILAIIAFSVPIISDRKFNRNHIKWYWEVKEPNRTKIDPLTQKPFQDNDKVVVNNTKDKMMAVTSWKYYRERQKEGEVGTYSELFPPQITARDFFSQRGIFRQLNWLWFGALGGFITWIIWVLLKQINWEPYLNLLAVLDTQEQISTSIFQETIAGLAMGAGIIGALAWVEERGQSRKFSLGRVLIRVLIGIVAAWFIFFLESALVAKFVPNELLRYFIGWTVFGTAMGWILSFFSSIEPLSGLKGGGIASFFAFIIYYLLNRPFFHEFLPTETIQVISYIIYAGILGYMIFTVVARLEDYELRCLSPGNFSGWQSPISKWLKSPRIDYILIGKHPKNRVYIKWDDSTIRPYHAKLSLIKNVPHIAPDEGRVLINNKAIDAPTPLSNGDKIRLGEESISILQFVTKTPAKKDVHKTGGNTDSNRLKVKSRSKKKTEQVRKQIKISRKSLNE